MLAWVQLAWITSVSAASKRIVATATICLGADQTSDHARSSCNLDRPVTLTVVWVGRIGTDPGSLLETWSVFIAGCQGSGMVRGSFSPCTCTVGCRPTAFSRLSTAAGRGTGVQTTFGRTHCFDYFWQIQEKQWIKQKMFFFEEKKCQPPVHQTKNYEVNLQCFSHQPVNTPTVEI